MKLLSNLPGIFKALRALGTLTQYRKQIREARQTGNISEEQKYILKATSKSIILLNILLFQFYFFP